MGQAYCWKAVCRVKGRTFAYVPHSLHKEDEYASTYFKYIHLHASHYSRCVCACVYLTNKNVVLYVILYFDGFSNYSNI